MYRKELRNGEFCVRYDGTETKVDIVGSLTLVEVKELIDTLNHALNVRKCRKKVFSGLIEF